MKHVLFILIDMLLLLSCSSGEKEQTLQLLPQPQMLTLPAQLDIEDLGDPEVLRLRLEHRPATGLAVGPRPQPLAVCAAHRGSNRATASTAIPSLRPTKPSFSVVVALILT